MTFISAHSKRFKQGLPRKGLTLVEIMIAMAIFASAVAIISSSSLFMTQWSIGVGNYLDMNQQGRVTLETLGRDLRMSSNVREATTSRITVDVADRPNQIRTVTYDWDSATNTLTRIEGNLSSVILESVEQLNIIYFDAIGNRTERAVDVKAVEISATLQRQIRRATNTNYLISARFTLRNKIVGN